jgi:hypothetical protein
MKEDFEILSQIKKEHHTKYIYNVPASYFDNLATTILLKVKAQQQTYNIPLGYFDNLSTHILTKIQTQDKNEVYTELQEIAPLLNSISKENVYQVPVNYFDKTINIARNQPAKVVIFQPKKWYKYAVAAAVIFATSVTFYWNNHSKFDAQILAQHNIALKTNVTQGVDLLQDETLNKAVENEKTVLNIDEITQNSVPFLGNVEEEVQQLSDEELNVYLQNNNLTKEEISNSNS